MHNYSNGNAGGRSTKLTVGDSSERSTHVSQLSVQQYAQLTGDFNPLHFSEVVARQAHFGRPTAQEGITVGLVHALVVMDLPGPGTVFTWNRWNFPAPVFVGDHLKARGELTKWDEKRRQGEMKFSVVRQDEVEVLTGTAGIYRVPLYWHDSAGVVG